MWNIARHMAYFGVTVNMCKICLIGANGGIGRHLALKLKLNKYVTDIALYDISDTAGICKDLSHIDTRAIVRHYSGGKKALIEALKCSNIVVIMAGQAHSKKFNSREAMFDVNAGLMLEFIKAIVSACPNNMPFIYIVTNPVNALVPLCAEYLKAINSYDPRKLIGSSSVDSMRARTFMGQLKNCDPSQLTVPVIGGHSYGSITPLISQSKPNFELTLMEQKTLAERIINGANEVIKAKKKQGAAQLSMGYCLERFCNSACRALYGDSNVVEVGYVASDVNELDFFSCNFTMDSKGVKECHRLPPMTEYEIELYYRAVKDVKENINRAKEFVENYITTEQKKKQMRVKKNK